MTSANNNVQEIFHAALEIQSAIERGEFLDQACAENPGLREQVDRLLRSHDKASIFLEQSPTATFDHSDAPTDNDATRAPNPAGPREIKNRDQLPRNFGDYELLEKIAQGGMGIVYKARQLSLNRVVAIKMILSGQFAGQDEIKRFHIEAEAAGKLDHAGIVPVFEVGTDEGRHYFSMAFIDGQSLSAKIHDGPLKPREAAKLTKKIAVAIQFAHDQGVVHRDLKPGNVLLDEQGEPRVTDFGLAKQVAGDSKLTTTGMILGTPSFMPPEQASGKEIDTAADVYSIGAIMYAMLTGRPPFEASSQLETILCVLQDEPTALRKIDKTIPKDLEAICLKCLEKESAERYATAADLSVDLQRFLVGEPIQAKNDIRRRVRKWSVREPVLVAHLMATLVLILLVCISFAIWHKNGADPTDVKNNIEANYHVAVSNVGILLTLALIVFVFQKVQNRFQTKFFIPYAWAAINPIFLTIVLWLNEGPHLAWLLSLYFLLIVTSCFFRRVDLVVITTVVSLLGYAVLLVQCFEWPPKNEAPSLKLIFAVNLIGTGALLCFLTLRLKRLGEQNT